MLEVLISWDGGSNYFLLFFQQLVYYKIFQFFFKNVVIFFNVNVELTYSTNIFM
jgi:hypothetical protein